MSHITEVKLQIKDLDALKEAAEALGFEFVEGQQTYNWYNAFLADSPEGRQYARERGTASMGKCEHALRLKGAKPGDYEVGIIKALDGNGFSIAYDNFGSGQNLMKAGGGKDLPTLRKEYAVAVATKRAQASLGRQGWRVERQDLEGGRVRLRVRKR